MSTRVGPKAASACQSDRDPPVGSKLGRTAVTCVRVSRMRDSADFERVLAQPATVCNRHFALHGLESTPRTRLSAPSNAERSNLSTGSGQVGVVPVDNITWSGWHAVSPRCIWLGVVVPKRYARHSVTRSLLKRQIRGGVDRHAASLPLGMWVVRLRATFDRPRFVSAASEPLRAMVRKEVDQLMVQMTHSLLGRQLNTPQP